MDHAATTPLDPRVLEAMLPFLSESFGNASSVHQRGRIARHAVERSRDIVADVLSTEPARIVFTSGGTESNNLALLGLDFGRSNVYTTRAEHEAVLRPVDRLEASGAAVQWCAIEPSGRIAESGFEKLNSAAPGALFSFMMVNNETGAVNDLARLSAVAAERGCILHSDAIQGIGYFQLRLDALGIDLLTLSAHKLYGPKGTGCVVVGEDVRISPTVVGGPQERERRGGTENVAGIVGFARALELADEDRDERVEHVTGLRVRLARGLRESVGEQIKVVTDENHCAPQILTIVVPPVDGRRVDGEMLLLSLDIEGLEVSAGAACSSGSLAPSHVLSAAGWGEAESKASVRFSLGMSNTADEVDRAVDTFSSVLTRISAQRTLHE